MCRDREGAANSVPEFIDLRLELRDPFQLQVQFGVDLVDLLFDDLQHLGSLRGRAGRA
jgi:hypothetical protein